jgi:uncharacterized membrane protein
MEHVEERRSRILTDADIQAIAEALRQHHADGITEEEHAEHHRCFKRWLDAQEKKQARLEAIKTQVGGWGIVIALGWIGHAVWSAFTTAVRVKTGQ